MYYLKLLHQKDFFIKFRLLLKNINGIIMKKSFLFLCLISLLFTTNSYSHDLKLYLKNLHRTAIDGDENMRPVYILNFDTLKVIYESDSGKTDTNYYPIKLPNMNNSADTGFAKIFFTGQAQGVFPREIMFLFGNFKSDTTYIWPDFNNNLDFTDDNAFYTLTKDNPYIYIPIPNSKNPEGMFLYKIGKAHYNDSEQENRYKEHFYNDDPKKGFITADCKYWYSEQRLNILTCDTVIDGKKIQIGLMDWNCNGLYNDIDTVTPNNFNSDRILVGEYGKNTISYKPCDGAAILLPETLIPINGKIYKLKDIDETGKYIIIKPTNKKYPYLQIGDTVPDLEFKLTNGEITSLAKHIEKGKFNLIDMWAVWCQGCVWVLPKLKTLDSQYSSYFNIISLHHDDDNIKYADSLFVAKGIKWTNGVLNAKIEKKLLSPGGFPYYVLIGPDGKILKFDPEIDYVENILKNYKRK